MDNPKNNPIYDSNTNTNDAPVIRYAEVLLNWIEAKAELGGVTQEDINASINQLRRRPLDATAQAKGLKNTADMVLADITENFDPARDKDVTPLIWEIRRERRMELFYEHCRLHEALEEIGVYGQQQVPGYNDRPLGRYGKRSSGLLG